ncbi:hypothetical protein M2168_005855 [Streptomyces sp. CZ24]|nr:hypothetical protein [Streptomyces sp. CZ24]
MSTWPSARGLGALLAADDAELADAYVQPQPRGQLTDVQVGQARRAGAEGPCLHGAVVVEQGGDGRHPLGDPGDGALGVEAAHRAGGVQDEDDPGGDAGEAALAQAGRDLLLAEREAFAHVGREEFLTAGLPPGGRGRAGCRAGPRGAGGGACRGGGETEVGGEAREALVVALADGAEPPAPRAAVQLARDQRGLAARGHVEAGQHGLRAGRDQAQPQPGHPSEVAGTGPGAERDALGGVGERRQVDLDGLSAVGCDDVAYGVPGGAGLVAGDEVGAGADPPGAGQQQRGGAHGGAVGAAEFEPHPVHVDREVGAHAHRRHGDQSARASGGARWPVRPGRSERHAAGDPLPRARRGRRC